MSHSVGAEAPAEGLRERKRRETLQRVAEAGMRLFFERGYEATTIDEIAAAAGVSRRSFFHYFKSKDEILLALQSGMGERFAALLRAASPETRPLDAVREAVLEVCAPYPAEKMIALDRLMRSSAAVQARKQASYVQQEREIFAALREAWPQPERETALRLTAMLAVGAMRLSFDTLSQENGARPIAEILRETFAALEAVLR